MAKMIRVLDWVIIAPPNLARVIARRASNPARCAVISRLLMNGRRSYTVHIFSGPSNGWRIAQSRATIDLWKLPVNPKIISIYRNWYPLALRSSLKRRRGKAWATPRIPFEYKFHTLSCGVDSPTGATTCFNRHTHIKSTGKLDYDGCKFSYAEPAVIRRDSTDALYLLRMFCCLRDPPKWICIFELYSHY